MTSDSKKMARKDDEFGEDIAHVFKLQDPASYCFNEKLFLKETFHVDKFVSECKDRVLLQTLREDLENYYKSIRVALIELINLDYADFVSLSSNLVGMEKSIGVLREPLQEIGEKIKIVVRCLGDTLNGIDKKLTQRKDIREKKMKLQHLLNVVSSVEKIEKILVADPGSTGADFFISEEPTSPGAFLERIAGEFNQLQFHVNQSKGHPLIERIRPRVSLITSKLQENLEKTFHESLVSKERDVLLRCLRTYALIDKTGHAEELFTNFVVKPFLDPLITERVLADLGLEHIFHKIVEFIARDCRLLLDLTKETAGSGEGGVKGFDFLVRSVWPEIDAALESRLSLVFSPGNPNLFFKRYMAAMRFLDEFESNCSNLASIQRLRQHSSYNSFMVKWSLPVYFQVRFQEIAGTVERAIAEPFQTAEGDFSTLLVSEVWRMECRCWDSEVFLPSLLGRFWKLSLQINSRLVTHLNSKVSSSTNGPTSDEEWSSRNVGCAIGDLTLLKCKLDVQFEEDVIPRFRNAGVDLDATRGAFAETSTSLSMTAERLSENLVSRLLHDSLGQLENAKNVPRLYRRTNREIPSVALPYVTTAFKPLMDFAEQPFKTLPKQDAREIVARTTTKICERYLSIVDELITSIKKTEDSLLRLKRQRKNPPLPTSSEKAEQSSDEHRMRKQILLDVEEFGRNLPSLELDPSEFSDFVKLQDIAKVAAE